MGLGLFVAAKIAGRGVLRRKPGRDQLFNDIRNSIHEYIADPLMARLMQVFTHEHTLVARLHPCAEPVEFLWKPDQTIRVSAKTSTLGPGYHAFLIEILQHIGTSLNLDWDWQEGGADEAGYVQTGDYLALQNEMASFWKSLGQIFMKQIKEGCKHIMLNMPLQYPIPQIHAFAITPLGPLSKESCEAMQSGDRNDLIAMCRRYYIWWDKDANAAFWRNTGMSLMWCDFPWHVPYKADERNIGQLALDCMNRAIELDGNINVPKSEIQELKSQLTQSDDAPPQPPSDEGIGYHRHVMEHFLTGGWSFCMPGYYFQDYEDDGAELVFWFGSRTIRFTSFTVSSKSDTDSSQKKLLESREKERSLGSEIIDINKGHVQGWATIKMISESDKVFWMLLGKAACSNSLGVITICYDDPADKDWAIETFKSILHPPIIDK